MAEKSSRSGLKSLFTSHGAGSDSLLLELDRRYEKKHKRRKNKGKPRKSCSCELLDEILDKLNDLDIPPYDAEEYKHWLARLRRKKIIRDLWYPEYQTDWG